MVMVSFWRYSDPDLLKWIRIRPNETDPSGSGFATLSQSESMHASMYDFPQTFVGEGKGTLHSPGMFLALPLQEQI